MFTSRIVPPLLFFLTLVFALSSCGKNQDNNSAARVHSWNSTLPLESVESDQGCLSVPKLFEGIRGLNPTLPLVTVPTAISFDSPFAIRDNFRRLVAYGQLMIFQSFLVSAQALPAVTQDGCTKLTVTGSDGIDQAFTVKTSAHDALMAEVVAASKRAGEKLWRLPLDDGQRLEYTWLSPQSIQSKRRYPAFDQPCGAGDKPLLVTVTKVLDWSGAGIPATVPEAGSPFSIDPAFLSLAAEAVGDSADSLSVAGSDGVRQLDLTKVQALTTKAPRPEVVSCDGGVAEPNPDPQPDPIDPEHPPHGNDTPGPNH